MRMLESKVALGALLNSAERYPAPYCHSGTRIAVKKVVKNWIGRRGFRSEKRIMWISGPPGVGKSAILQTVCEELSGEIVSHPGGDGSNLGDDDGGDRNGNGHDDDGGNNGKIGDE